MEKELAKEVLTWWEKHKFDCNSDEEGEEYSIYNKTPDMVDMAKDVIENKENGIIIPMTEEAAKGVVIAIIKKYPKLRIEMDWLWNEKTNPV